MPFSLVFLFALLRHVMCGVFADAFPAKSGAHDVPVNLVILSST